MAKEAINNLIYNSTKLIISMSSDSESKQMKEMFNRAQKKSMAESKKSLDFTPGIANRRYIGNSAMQFSSEESEKFKKAFDDPEFRKLFADYLDEMQDPKNREENEEYINQLERENEVPEGKELIR
jgi:hypothetical protein